MQKLSKKIKEEIYRLRNLFQEEGLADIVIVRGGSLKDNAGGYCLLSEKPPAIKILCDCFNKDALLSLLHEIGHVKDYNRYKQSKRWKLTAFDYTSDTVSTAVDYSKTTRYAFAITEYIAEEKIKGLLKKYAVLIPITVKELYQNQTFQTIVKLWEMYHGKIATDTAKKGMIRFSYKQGRITQDDVRRWANPINFKREVLCKL